jgi:heat shock protein HslJ
MKTLTLGMLVASVALASCGVSNTMQPAANMSLDNTQWKLAALGNDPVAPAPSVTLRFGPGGIVSGSDGCNNYRGTYTTTGDNISIKLGPSTLMACPDPVMKQAQAFSQALNNARKYSATKAELLLKDDKGATLAKFGPLLVASLQSTKWTAQGINNGRGGVETNANTPKVNAVFGADGRVSGETGCNNYTGAYTTDGSKIKISGLVVTSRECIEAGVMDLQAQYLKALERATTYDLGENSLELRDDTGALQVRYTT